MTVIRNDAGEPFSKWKPSDKFAWQWKETGLSSAVPKPEYVFDERRKWRLDYAWPEIRLAVEIDGFGFGHQAIAGMTQDNEKANAAVKLGWRVLRFNSAQLGSKAKVAAAVDLVNEIMCGVTDERT